MTTSLEPDALSRLDRKDRICIAKYGPWMNNLIKGEVKPQTKEQQVFITDVKLNRRDSSNEFVGSWLRYNDELKILKANYYLGLNDKMRTLKEHLKISGDTLRESESKLRVAEYKLSVAEDKRKKLELASDNLRKWESKLIVAENKLRESVSRLRESEDRLKKSENEVNSLKSSNKKLSEEISNFKERQNGLNELREDIHASIEVINEIQTVGPSTLYNKWAEKMIGLDKEKCIDKLPVMPESKFSLNTCSQCGGDGACGRCPSCAGTGTV